MFYYFSDWKPPSLQADDHLQYFDVILNGCLMSRVDPDVCKLLLDETCIEGVVGRECKNYFVVFVHDSVTPKV